MSDVDAVIEIERLRAEVELLHDDAMRYRWLRKQKALRLVSDGAVWKRENGENFRASHALWANDTRYGVYETLDETIDEAMRGALSGEHVAATAKVIDRIIRRRMAEAWDEGYFKGWLRAGFRSDNPYRGRKKK